ncbi:MAG: hypothetical protein AAFN70_14180, partial [Planctomycetota bacterium]
MHLSNATILALVVSAAAVAGGVGGGMIAFASNANNAVRPSLNDDEVNADDPPTAAASAAQANKDQAKTAGQANKKDAAKESQVRFDETVREDLFAGFDGDANAMKRGLEKCRVTLEKNPDHAEALVWQGAGKMFLSGQAFSKGNLPTGMKLWGESIAEMDRAKKLEPENIGVLIPRAAVMINAGRNAPGLMGRPLLVSVRDDFLETYKRQKKTFDQLGDHSRGELRMGLADVFRLLGQTEESRQQLMLVKKELEG